MLRSQLRCLTALLLAGLPSRAASQSDSMSLRVTMLGHVIVPADINGMPAQLVLDPISGIILDRRWVVRNGLTVLDGPAAGFAGRVTVGGAGAERREALFVRDVGVRIGPAITRATRTVVDLDSLLRDAIGHRVDGLVGLDAFPGKVLGLSATAASLTIVPRAAFVPPPDARPLPVRFDRGVRPIVPITLGIGERGAVNARAYFDLGMSGNLRLTAEFAKTTGIVAAYCKAGRATAADSSEVGLGGALPSIRLRLPHVVLGSDTIAKDLVATAAQEQVGADAAPDWDILVGWGLMRWADWWFDREGGRIWYRRNGRATPPNGSAETGIGFEPMDGPAGSPLRVASVAAGSAAARAGMRPADVLTAIDDRPVSAEHAEIVLALLSHRETNRALTVRRRDQLIRLALQPRETLTPGGGCR